MLFSDKRRSSCPRRRELKLTAVAGTRIGEMQKTERAAVRRTESKGTGKRDIHGLAAQTDSVGVRRAGFQIGESRLMLIKRAALARRGGRKLLDDRRDRLRIRRIVSNRDGSVESSVCCPKDCGAVLADVHHIRGTRQDAFAGARARRS